MENNPKNLNSKSDQIVLTVLRPARVILKDGSVFVADAYSSSPIGFYVIGFWDQESLKVIEENWQDTDKKIYISPDGKSKMTLIPWGEIRAVSFLIEEIKPAESPQG